MTPTLNIDYGANWFVRAFVLLLAGLAVLAATASPAQAGTVQVKVDNPKLAKAFGAAASGMRIRLDSSGGSVVVPGVDVLGFQMPKLVHTVSGGIGGWLFPNSTLTARLRDINTLAFNARIVGKYVELTAPFETDGTEVELECITELGGSCPNASKYKRYLKAIQLEDARLTIRLRMEQIGTWIYYDTSEHFIDVSFDAKVEDAAGTCTMFEGLCSELEELVSSFPFQLKIEQHVDYALGWGSDWLGSLARQQLVDDGVIGSDWRLLQLHTSRGFWTLTMVRPPFIDAGTVRIVDFRPLTKHVAHTCPVGIGFTASISVGTSVSGRVWLRHENGTISPKLDWSSGAGTASSRLTRMYRPLASKRPGDRWSKLVVEWQDQWGRTYQTTSSAANYSVTCLEPTDSVKNG